MEGMYIKSENQSHLITLEKEGNNSPQIQVITDKEDKQIKTDNSSVSDKKIQQAEKETNQQNPSQKADDKDDNRKNIYYGVGVSLLVILVISL